MPLNHLLCALLVISLLLSSHNFHLHIIFYLMRPGLDARRNSIQIGISALGRPPMQSAQIQFSFKSKLIILICLRLTKGQNSITDSYFESFLRTVISSMKIFLFPNHPLFIGFSTTWHGKGAVINLIMCVGLIFIICLNLGQFRA